MKTTWIQKYGSFAAADPFFRRYSATMLHSLSLNDFIISHLLSVAAVGLLSEIIFIKFLFSKPEFLVLSRSYVLLERREILNFLFQTELRADKSKPRSPRSHFNQNSLKPKIKYEYKYECTQDDNLDSNI